MVRGWEGGKVGRWEGGRVSWFACAWSLQACMCVLVCPKPTCAWSATPATLPDHLVSKHLFTPAFKPRSSHARLTTQHHVFLQVHRHTP
jgi:hypothetical protein